MNTEEDIMNGKVLSADDYIRRGLVIDAIRYRVCQGQGNKEHICKRGSCAYCGIMEIMCDISSISSADVQPVIHAYWIELPKALNLNENPCKCSNCGHILSFMNHYPKSKYCDECGAKMDVIFQDDKVRAIKVTDWKNDENG